MTACDHDGALFDPDAPDDLTILRQIADGDLAWFDVFARRHGGRLVAWLHSHLRDHHTAEELAQDVLLAVFKAARDGRFDDRRQDRRRRRRTENHGPVR